MATSHFLVNSNKKVTKEMPPAKAPYGFAVLLRNNGDEGKLATLKQPSSWSNISCGARCFGRGYSRCKIQQ